MKSLDLSGERVRELMEVADKEKAKHNRLGGNLAETGRQVYSAGAIYNRPDAKNIGMVLKARGLIIQNPNNLEYDLRRRRFIDYQTEALSKKK